MYIKAHLVQKLLYGHTEWIAFSTWTNKVVKLKTLSY